MKRFSNAASLIFGILMLVLSLAVTLETLLRKMFSVSLGGIDELSGYAIAIGAPLAFAVALLERSHIRINVLYLKLGERTRGLLDGLSIIALAALAVFLTAFTWVTLRETQAYQSIAQTPWATPLIYPQALWMAAMVAFLLPALAMMAQALALLARGEWQGLVRLGSPPSVEEELDAELEDLKNR